MSRTRVDPARPEARVFFRPPLQVALGADVGFEEAGSCPARLFARNEIGVGLARFAQHLREDVLRVARVRGIVPGLFQE